MSLTGKTTLIIFAVITGYVALAYYVLTIVVGLAFQSLEDDTARRNMVRVRQTVLGDIDRMTAVGDDWSEWDDTYEFILGRNEPFRDSTLVNSSLVNIKVNMLLLFDSDQRLAWGRLLDIRSEDVLDLKRVIPSLNKGSESILEHRNINSSKSGLLVTEAGPMMISSQPIITTERQGPIAGTLVVGKFLNSAQLETVRARTKVDIDVYPISAIESAEHKALIADLVAGRPGSVTVRSEDQITDFAVLEDVYGDGVLLLQVRTPRDIGMLGSRTIQTALIFLLGAGLVLMAVMWFALRYLVTGPVATLSAHIKSIRRSGDLSKKVDFSRRDEIGHLADAFDTLTGELSGARSQLLEQSFKAGMAETAAAVLHNLRNALTPLMHRITKAARQLEKAKLENLPRALAEMDQPDIDPDRRTKLIQYLGASSNLSVAAQQKAVDDLRLAEQQARQVAGILKEQEQHTYSDPVIESIPLREVFDEATQCLAGKDNVHARFDIDKSAENHAVYAHRLGLVQVISNLLINASESIEQAQQENGRISLLTEPELRDDRQMIHVTVIDNGTGIAEDRLNTIFQRGHTTKRNGNGGLGLHWCANTISAMDGRLYAESDGPGQGAKFHLLVPAASVGDTT